MREVGLVSCWLVASWFVLAGCADGRDRPSTRHSSSGSGGAPEGVGGAMGTGGAAGAAGAAGERACSSIGTPRLEASCRDGISPFASEVVDYAFGSGQDTGQDEFPELVLGPPEGKGPNQGSSDGVVSLGNGGWVILGFGENAIVDGPGVDFIVFENAFFYGAEGENVFAELATVSVSADGEHWIDFPCTATEPPYGSCAGWHPVLANGEQEELSELDPATAGGDAYDLGEICLDYARFVRITDREDLDAPLDGVFDLDAVGIVNAACEQP